jgi:hemolysin III
MKSEITCPISGETEKEERINHLTHLFGLFLSLIGLALLLNYLLRMGNLEQMISYSIYGATLFMLYTASTFYHHCKSHQRKRLLKIIDHVCIYLLIAGSYTPYTMGPLKEVGGVKLMFCVWSIAFIGIAFKILAIDRFKKLSLCAYLGMGWLVLFSLPILTEVLPLVSLVWLIAAGVIYSAGILFYLWESLPFNHGIWHLFVLGGSFCHYCSILEMI